MNRTCPPCGVSIEHRHPLAKFCTVACSQWHRKHPGAPRPSRRCLACGASLAGRHPTTKVCDKNCGHWAIRHPGVPRPLDRACVSCGGNIDHLLLTATTCNNACMRWHQNHPDGELRKPPTHCVMCGQGIVGRRADTDVCSIRCRERRPVQVARRRDKESRRRARKAGAVITARRLAAIFDRDHWTCYLCTEAIDPSIPWPDRMSKSIDHVIPLARGGSHAVENLRAAHLGCNSRKGARVDAMAGATGTG